MVQSLVAWSESQDSATLVNAAAVADQHVRIVGDDVVVPAFAPLLGAYYALGVNFTLGQFTSPSLRTLFNIDVEPADVLAEPSSIPPVHDLFRKPIALKASEALNFLMAEDAAGASRVNGFAWLLSAASPPDNRPDFTIRATNTSTLTTFAWSNGALTFSQTLPAGKYDIVGARAQSAGLVAFRFVLTGASHRPGGVGFDTDGDVDYPAQRHGGWGIWGSFEHDAPPTVDFFSVSADTSQVVHLDLVKTG